MIDMIIAEINTIQEAIERNNKILHDRIDLLIIELEKLNDDK